MDELSIRYYGWSTLCVQTRTGNLFFDPFYRRYCDTQWFSADELTPATYIALTHGHEEHFLDVPEFSRLTGAKILGSSVITRFLQRRHGFKKGQLITLDAGGTADINGFKVRAFAWQHRDVNLVRTVLKSLLKGRIDLVTWSWHSLMRNPFWAPFVGYRLALPGGTTIVNYNEGFNTKMTHEEVSGVARLGHTDILLGGMQLDFMDDLARGVATLKPKAVLLYPPHEVLHKVMGVPAHPWSEFEHAVRAAAPDSKVILLEPGTQVDFPELAVTRFK